MGIGMWTGERVSVALYRPFTALSSARIFITHHGSAESTNTNKERESTNKRGPSTGAEEGIVSQDKSAQTHTQFHLKGSIGPFVSLRWFL